jgi:hypothetical protein
MTISGTPVEASCQSQPLCGFSSWSRASHELARLGSKVWHDSPAATMATLEELEETARW